MNKKKRKIVQGYVGDKLIYEFESAREAYRQLGIEYKNISANCLGKRNYAGMYNGEYIRWQFKQ